MTEHKTIKVIGRVGDIFAHRFVIETTDHKKILADLGPKGAEAFPLKTGTEISAEGEMKPSELKVARIARAGAPPVAIEHKKKPEHEMRAAPGEAVKAIEKAGFEPLGEPRRKPKHFEVLGRKEGKLVECHVEFDGHIRKEKPVGANDEKWSAAIKAAA